MKRAASPPSFEAKRKNGRREEESDDEEKEMVEYVQSPPSAAVILARERRKNEMKEGMIQIERHCEIALFHEETQKFLKCLRQDEQLKGYWDWKTDGLHRKRLTKEALKLQRQIGKYPSNSGKGNHAAPECMQRFVGKNRYVAPERRIRITENVRQDASQKIPVYSDIPGETLENIDVPDNVCYEYLDRNRIDFESEPLLAEAVRIAEQEQNIIKCQCCSSEPLIPCYENEDCPCSKMNKALESLQDRKPENRTRLNSSGPMLIQTYSGTTKKNVGFACSEACGCKGQCSNNPFLIVEKKIIPFEVFRRDTAVGFGIRSPIFIPGGTPVLEFCGQIIEDPKLTLDASEYAMQVVDDEAFHNFVRRMGCGWTEEHKKMLDVVWNVIYVIDCKWQGSLARTAAHSCAPNLEILRIYQKSFTPAHQRLLLIPNSDVFPGIPLTIDYGLEYVQDRFQNNCLCGTFACSGNPEIKKFRECSAQGLLKCLRYKFEKELEDHENDEKRIREKFATTTTTSA